MAIFNIPLDVGQPQTFPIQLSGVEYQLTFRYRNAPDGGWILDIADVASNPIINGIPLVTGANLLDQYQHLFFRGALFMQTTSDPDAVPTFANLGEDALLYWVDAT